MDVPESLSFGAAGGRLDGSQRLTVFNHILEYTQRSEIVKRGAVAADRGRTKEEVAGEAWQFLYRYFFEGDAQRCFRSACEATGLSPGVLKTLLSLQGGQPTSMGELAEIFRCDPSYVTTLVDGLESEGLAERKPRPTDRRVKDVVLTDLGSQTLTQVRKVLGEPPPSLAKLSVSELRQLRDLMLKLSDA
jgi:DNA-binding MarR family transcriptional regulator